MLAEDARRDVEDVLENCRKHLRINPRDALALFRRGLTLLLLGRSVEGVTDLEAGARLQPDYRVILEQAVAHVKEYGNDSRQDGPLTLGCPPPRR